MTRAGPPRAAQARSPAGLWVALAVGALVSALAPASASAQIGDPCAPLATNPVACENSKPGTSSDAWRITGAGDPSIQGFATKMSVNKGETISFKISSSTPSYRIDILRLGYYGGRGARLIASNLSPTSTASQPACQTFSDTGLIDCGNWSVSRTWTVPNDVVSGVYIANLVRNDTGGNSHITFVVRDDARSSDIVVQTSDATWQAYNRYGGNSLYVCSVACPPGNPAAYKAAFKVSYNRPFNTNQTDGTSFIYNGEYPMIRFLERMAYDVSYLSQVDTETSPALLRKHKVFMSSGHDEYWSANQRSNVTAARDAGVNLAFFSGNEMFWKTRFENGTRTLVSYKDTHFDAATDPVEWTGTWRDPRFAAGHEPENALIGQSFIVNEGTSEITVPAEYKALRLWRNTAVAALGGGQNLRLGTSTLGYEWDEDPDNGYRPAGQFRLSSTTVGGLVTFTDYGSTTKINGTATHNLTMYRAASGALVFGAGTVQWSWGLDDENFIRAAPDRNMQQATVNLFADMGAQPANLIPNVVAASKSTDITKPTSTIATYPASIADGAVTTISGTASDGGGGVVAAVEISTDGGATWHPVTSGTSNWSHTWIAHGTPTATIRTRAVDDSGNLETPGAGRTVTVNCPCSLWGSNFPVPAEADSGDRGAIEVGMKFTSDKYGVVSGMRFYKFAANTGTHIGNLWSAGGTRLATATFTNETTSGWQTVSFSQPVQIMPGTTYVVSYHAPAGRYAATASYMYRNPAPVPQGGGVHEAGPLRVVRDFGSQRNGVFIYGTESRFPSNSFGAANYWVDVLFAPTPAPGQARNVTATSGGRTSANVYWDPPSTGGTPTSYIVTPYVGNSAQAPKTVTGSPLPTSTNVSGLANGTTYTFKVTASNPTGDGPPSASSNAVTPLDPVPPSAPTNVDALAGTTSAKVTWTASAADGDSAITGYTVTPYVGAAARTPVTVGASTTSTVVTGLTNGTVYTFTVKANNGVGSSPESAASPAVTPQSMLFDFQTPPTIDAGDPDPIELGVKFTADVSGSVTGVRFYKAPANTGTHVGNLWTASGTLLAQATFTDESASGWQTATFASPVQITAGATYVASYFAPNGRYSHGTFAGPVKNGVLRTISDDIGTGVYRYGVASGFPTRSYQASNYWVDVTFAVPVPGQVTGTSATPAGKSSAAVSWSAPSNGGTPDRYLVTAYEGSTALATKTVTGTPLPTSTTVTGLTTGTTYTFKVTAANMNGAGPASAASNAVTPITDYPPTAPTGVVAEPAASSARVSWTAPVADGGTPITGYTVTPYIGTTAQPATIVDPSATSKTITGLKDGTAYSFRVKATNEVGDSPQSDQTNAVTPGNTLLEFGSPATSDSGDTSAINLGMRFVPETNGEVTGVRFYKDRMNTGTHVGALWNANGALLAQVTFTGESASGWQSATFASPVSVTAGQTYTVSYFAPVGRYSFTPAGLSSPIVKPPLRSASGPNGVYGYGSSVGFPATSFNATNYWVDVLYTSPPPPNPPTNVTAAAGQGSATVSWTAPASGPPPTSYEVQPRVGGSPVGSPKTIGGSPPATTATVTGLTGGTSYTFTVRAVDANGASAPSAPSNAVTPTAATAPGTPTGVAAQGDSTAAIVRWTAPPDGGDPISDYDVIPRTGSSTLPATTVPGTATSAVVTGLSNGTSYSFTVRARNGVGTGAESAATEAVVPRSSIFQLATPPQADAGDRGSVNLGVKFRSDVAGSVTGVRFYKSAANTGTHVGSLWSATGTLLARGTFSGETASGWQALTFATPVAIDANTTYVVSYLAPSGGYSATGQGFATAVYNAPLQGVADSFSSNGLYAYSASAAFPDRTFNAANYWVDVLFAPGG